MISLICGIYLNMIQMNIFTQQKQIHRSQNQTYGYQSGNMEGSDRSLGLIFCIYTLVYIK